MQQHLDASVFRRFSVFIRGIIGRIVRKLVGRHCFGSVGVRQSRGSSTSVGITAGAAALLVEWHLQQKKIPSVSTALIKSLLTLGATRNPDMKYPNREWGYGQLNLYNTFEAMRQL